MRNVNRVLLSLAVCYALFTGLIIYRIVYGVLPFYGGRWKLVWSDEFNTPALDLTRWTPVNQASSPRGELQAFIDENVGVKDGFLILTSKKEAWTGPDNLRPGQAVTREFTAGQVVTAGKCDWSYGRFEIRAKFPTGRGVAPRFLLLPAEGNVNSSAIEIGGCGRGNGDAVYLVDQWTAADSRWDEEVAQAVLSQETAGFHIFTIEWEPGTIRWYIDGVLRHRIKRNVPEGPCFLALKTSIGGIHRGAPDLIVGSQLPETLPRQFLIDWVRVYQRR